MKSILVLVFIIFLFPLSQGIAGAEEVAIIVNKLNTTDEVSFSDLVKILKQESQFWRDGKKIYLVMQEAGNPEKKIVLEKIYNMDDEGLKKFWLTKMFKGEISSFPKTLSSNESVRHFVSQVPNAIGFINASLVDETVKVLRIDGKLPGEDSYILKD